MDLPGFLQNLLIPGGMWGIVCLFLALINLKSLPFVWHYRLFRPLFRHYFFSRSRPCTPSSLFQPIIYTSHSPPMECDYNLHKSNSTYFSDLDVARSQLISILLTRYFDAVAAASKEEREQGRWSFALGAVTCHFRREIRPYQKYEMWTKVLAWDRKWLYLVTHMVEAGKVKPKSYSLQPWRKGSTTSYVAAEGDVGNPAHKAIFATSVARYVFKRGRMTIPVETILMIAGLLPAKPEGASAPEVSAAETSALEATTSPALATGFAAGDPGTDNKTDATEPKSDSWDWKRVEEERAKGMEFANHVGALDGLQGEFNGDAEPALGYY